MKNVYDLPRNNVVAALNIHRRELLAGTWSPDKASVMIQLQDDPTELMNYLERMSEEPAIAAALARINF